MNTKVKLLGLGIVIILISGYFSALNTEISIYGGRNKGIYNY